MQRFAVFPWRAGPDKVCCVVSARSYGVVQPHDWRRIRLHLGGSIVAGLLAPFAVASLVSPHLVALDVFYSTFLASLIAIVAGYYFFQSLVAFPGINASYYIIPVLSSSFAAVFTVLLLLRLDYSRPLLIVSYVGCIAWYYVVYFGRQARSDLRIGVVPIGDVGSLHEIAGVVWETLDTPRSSWSRHNAIVADFTADMPDAWEGYLADAALSGKAVLHVRQLRESLTGRVEIRNLSENAHGSLIPQAAYMTPKFLVDVIVAGVALLILLPLLVVVAVSIKATSHGPVFFRQERVGHRGHPFLVWKFRTMTHGAAPDGDASSDEARTAAITLDNDARITPIGRLLRRTRIDELPQLLNVLAGQMSFIGPRPEAAVLAQWYQQEIPFYRYRHIVRPGITGWAQVNQGHVADVEAVHSKLHYDFYYISNFSLWLDILIVIRTVQTIVTGFGHK